MNYTFCFREMLENFVTSPTYFSSQMWLTFIIYQFIKFLLLGGGVFNLYHLTFLKDSPSMITTLWYTNFFCLSQFLILWFYTLDFLKAEIKVSQLLLPSDWFYLQFAFQKLLLYTDSMLISLLLA